VCASQIVARVSVFGIFRNDVLEVGDHPVDRNLLHKNAHILAIETQNAEQRPTRNQDEGQESSSESWRNHAGIIAA
jgi:hypothetical protein